MIVAPRFFGLNPKAITAEVVGLVSVVCDVGDTNTCPELLTAVTVMLRDEVDTSVTLTCPIPFAGTTTDAGAEIVQDSEVVGVGLGDGVGVGVGVGVTVGDGIGVGVGQLGGIGVRIAGPSVISSTALHDKSYLIRNVPGILACSGQLATSINNETGAPLIVPPIAHPFQDEITISASLSRSCLWLKAEAQSGAGKRVRRNRIIVNIRVTA